MERLRYCQPHPGLVFRFGEPIPSEQLLTRADSRTSVQANPGVSIPLTCVQSHRKGLSIAEAHQIDACLAWLNRGNAILF